MAYTTIKKPSDYFNTLLRTGNYAGSGTTAITGVGFAPGLMWEKKRNGTSIHALLDQVRGNSKQIRSEDTGAETTTSQYASIDSDGFTVNNSGDYGGSDNLVSWHWKANGQGSSNTDGTINTTYTSANTTAGFSIVKYTGTGSVATVGHGLGVAPKMMLIRILGDVNDWQVYHQSLGNTHRLILNDASASSDQSNRWNDTSPTSSVFTLGTHSSVNASGATYIAYCFAEKQGYSKIGSFIGNGNADGSFIYTGFKPAFVIYKRYDSGSYSWVLVDNKRNTFNAVDKYVHPDLSAAEGTVTLMDFLSNGFKMRVNDTTSNQGSIIYMAFGQSIVGSNNVPATAR